MPSLKILQFVNPGTSAQPFLNDLLDGFRQYAAIPEVCHEEMLLALLKTAVLKVQEYADRALVETKLELVDDIESSGDELKLYMGGGEIVSLTDASGNAVSYERLSDTRLKVLQSGTVKCVYITSPVETDRDLCRSAVLRYATALYDGDDKEVLNSILNEVL